MHTIRWGSKNGTKVRAKVKTLPLGPLWGKAHKNSIFYEGAPEGYENPVRVGKTSRK